MVPTVRRGVLTGICVSAISCAFIVPLSTAVSPAHAGATPIAAESVDGEFAGPSAQRPGDFPVPAQRDPATQGAPQTADAIPGLGPKTMAQLPAQARQVIVSTTPKDNGTTATTTLYQRTGETWEKKAQFAGHNGAKGWKVDRREGDRTSPAGVFSLTDAGGYLANPGTKMPYTQDDSLRSNAQRTYGDGYARVFDYVIAINYNRKPGTPPTDGTRPLGWDKGGKIWLHVDHDSPTRGCVSVTQNNLKYILKTLDPAAHPHIVMGPASFISQ